jgi:hypothetical protein
MLIKPFLPIQPELCCKERLRCLHLRWSLEPGAGIQVEKILTISARQKVSGFFDSVARKLRELLRSE